MYARIKGNARRSPELSTNFLLAISSPIIGELRRLTIFVLFSFFIQIHRNGISDHLRIIQIYFEAPTCRSYFNFMNYFFFCLSHGMSIQLLIQLLIQSHVKSAQDNVFEKCLRRVLAFASLCRLSTAENPFENTFSQLFPN